LNFIKNSISIILVFAVLNTFTAKAVHEFFEHHDVEHTCINKELTHFHKYEMQHVDLICSFSISTSLLTDFSHEFKNTIQFFNNQLRVQIFQLAQNLFHYHFLLRGPPSIK